MKKEIIKGKLQKIVFESDGFVIARFKTEYKKTVSIKGNLTIMNDNQVYELTGVWVPSNQNYDPAFSVSEIKVQQLTDNNSLVEYLCSIPSVGPVLAKKIVDKFDKKTLSIIRDNPQELLLIDKIKDEQIENIKQNFIDNELEYEIINTFNKFKISYKVFEKLKQVYSLEKISKLLNENPYEFLDSGDSQITSFEAVDKLYLEYKKDPLSELRIGYVSLYLTKRHYYKTGDTYIEYNRLKELVMLFINGKRNFFEISDQQLQNGFMYAKNQGFLIFKQYKIFITKFYHAEYSIRNFLNSINKSSRYKEKEIEEIIEEIQKEYQLRYDKLQIEALKKSVLNNFSIITGGPGTGKTTVIRGIIKIYKKIYNKPKIILTAPTGKAARRMKEQTDMKASTIHKILEWKANDFEYSFEKEKELKADVLIIDEASMVDLLLFDNLVSYLSDVKHLILIGDPNQLPSVNPGNVLEDIIESKKYPTTYLTRVYRQGEDNHIVDLCYSVLLADNSYNFDNKQDVVFYDYMDSNTILEKTISHYMELVKIQGINHINDIQVAIPKYRGPTGIDAINERLQKEMMSISKPNKLIKIMGQTYYLGDKIMQTKNRPELDIYNGDNGSIDDIIKNEKGVKTIRAKFNDSVIEFPSDMLSDIKLSYAASVHKLQGSEYNYLILVINSSDSFMLNKNLIYTAISRSKNKLIIIGQKATFFNSVQKNIVKRLTMLKERINE